VSFDGIPFEALDFYEDLEADNSKGFWLKNKEVYDLQVKAPLEALAAELAPAFGPAKLFRPYRDVRFARDKTPYKTHQGAYFGESHRYLHISASGLFVGGGYFHMESDQIARYRRSVAEDLTGAALVGAVSKATKGSLTLGGNQMTRVPSGYPKEHERSDLLKYRSLTASREFGSPDWLKTAKAKPEVVKAWRAMQPLIDWLLVNVGNSDKPVEENR
jgi:uncharacterized protein (TIGR02453 family)